MISRVFDAANWIWDCVETRIERAEGWFLSRRWEFLPGALPSLIVAIVMVLIVVGQRGKSAIEIAEPYRQMLRDASRNNDYEQAELCFRKLVELDVVDEFSRFQFAMLAYERGYNEVAQEQIVQLAPEDGTGYPPAHFWLAESDLRQFANWQDADRRHCVRHLVAAKADASLRTRAAEYLGIICFVARDYSTAADEMKSIPNPTLHARVVLASALANAGRAEDARTEWTDLAAASQRELTRSPDNVDLRLLAAIALGHLNDHEKAIEVLRDGLKQSSGESSSRLQEAIALAMVRKLSASNSNKLDANERQKMLQELLDASTQSPALALRLLRWSSEDLSESQQVRVETARHLEASGKNQSLTHATLGTTAAEEGKLDDARQHLEQALQINPTNPLILNNLAWVLANSQPAELERAVELANAAVRLMPESADFRETRGQILMRQQQWSAAVQDLEWALPKLKPTSTATVQAALAKAYEQLGNVERARFYLEMNRMEEELTAKDKGTRRTKDATSKTGK